MDRAVRELFHEVADLSAEERQRIYIDRGVSSALQQEVESLLGFDAEEAQYFTACVAGAASEVLQSTADQIANNRCGPYRLVRRIGSGGMGTVYLGERADGELQQQVAIKLISAHDDRAGWRERFLRERQLLASLQHPAIVRVLDAGHTADQRPYLVMEYVDGVPIDRYAEALPLREKLRLFQRVCEAVAYAHRHLIIHRDLKPSNILVDSAGQPKLLDFGIAKLLGETGERTQTIERLLTPHYASPEQVRGAVQTTATDVYSLGAVLYKLLAGRSPQEGVEGRQTAMAPSAVAPEVPSDLDCIVMKALRTEPEERYASVEAFANDVEALLESRPVAARHGNTWYRARKFTRRYWLPIAAGLLAVTGLAVGLFIANYERVKAERRFTQLRQLSSRVLDLDRSIRNLSGSTQARQKLVSVTLEYLEGLAADARGDLDLTREVSEGYWRVARVQGVPTELNLGDRATAEANLKKADELITLVLVKRPNDHAALLIAAVVAGDRMILAEEDRRRSDGVAFAQIAKGRIERFLATGSITHAESQQAGTLLANIALSHVNMHRYATAVEIAKRGLQVTQGVPEANIARSGMWSVMANAARYQGDLDAALDAIRQARREVTGLRPSGPTQRLMDTYGVLLREGMILGEDNAISLGRPDEAVVPLREAFELSETAAAKDSHDSVSRGRVATSGRELADILRRQDPKRALEIYDLALRRLREIPASVKTKRDEALVLANSSYALQAVHQGNEARQRVDRALALLAETKDYPAAKITLDGTAFAPMLASADLYGAQGASAWGVAVAEELLTKVAAAIPGAQQDLRDAPPLSHLYESLAKLYRAAGDTAKASEIEARRESLWRYWEQKLPRNAFVQRQLR